jgi:tRNA modification GTPase
VSRTSRILLNQRHVAELETADAALARAAAAPECVESEPELAAADLRAALDAIGRIAGAVSSDDILGLIFGRFCVGK